ncbi:MAG TPA: methyltransferase [Vicinamibacterales bacterium]|jgi:hypothetical protein
MPAFDEVFGSPVFEYLARNPEAAAVFDQAMTSISAEEARATAGAYDVDGIRTLMDVAGGHGLLLATVLQRRNG